MAKRKLIVEIVGDSRSAQKAFKDVSASANQFSRQIEGALGSRAGGAAATLEGFAGKLRGNAFAAGLTGGAVALGASEIGAQLKQSISLASDLGEAISKNQQIFGESADAIDQWSRTTARGIGLARGEAIAAAGDFGGLFATLRVAPAAAAAMSRSLVQLASDLASFNNTSVEDAIAALRSGLVGESEPLRKFQVLLSEARVKATAYAEGIAKAGTELTEAQKVQARYALILKDTATAQGDFARTSGSLANQSRTLRAQLTDLQTSLGQLATPYLTDAARAANETVAGLQELSRALDDLDRRVEQVTGRSLVGGIDDTATAIARATLESNQLTRPLVQALDILRQIGQQKKTFADLTAGANAFREAISLRDLKGNTIFDLQPQKAPQLPDLPTPPFKGAAFDAQGGLDVFRNIGKTVQAVLDGVNAELDATQTRIDQAAERAQTQRDAFQTLMDRLALSVDVAAASGNLKAQLAALREQEQALREQVRIEGHTVELDRRLFELRQQRIDLRNQARNARQFKSLGLDVAGNEIAATRAQITAQLRQVSKAIDGTVADTSRNNKTLAAIRKLILDPTRKVSGEVRDTIRRMLDDIQSQIGEKAKGPLTRTSGLNTRKIIEGLGLSGDQAREIRGRLSGFNTSGVGLAGAGRVPTGGFVGGVLVEAHTTVQLDGQTVGKTVTRHQQKNARRNPPQKRGPNRRHF